MRPNLLFVATIFFSLSSLNAQLPWDGKQKNISKNGNKHVQHSRTLTGDICGNNLDDDGNGLKDCEDFACYFNNGDSGCNCVPIDVVWVCTEEGKLYWINHQTRVEHYVGQMAKIMPDITWAPNGKLYGVDWEENKIWEIDPVSAQLSFVTTIPGYDASNAMTSDASGNLYIASRLAGGGNTWHIIKVNPGTGQVSMIADLTPSGSFSAGDLAFAYGTLYLACTNNRIATINVNTGAIITTPITGLFYWARIYGIVVKADGTLYLGDNNNLYRLSPGTMDASLHYTCTTPGMNIWGMSSFNDYCLAPGCYARVNIAVESNLPYCSSSGVGLKANGWGLNGNSSYKWTLPDGSIQSTQSITAMISGTYRVKYAAVTDTCHWEDSITLQITETPVSKLPADTMICLGTSINLLSSGTTQITSYLWQDGSVNPVLPVTKPGVYWLQTSNACGTSRDTIIIGQAMPPRVELGPGSEICEFDKLLIRNFLDSTGYQYKWIDNSTQKFLVPAKTGLYWVDVTNACGTTRDSVLVTEKTEGCECSLYMPTAFTPNNDGRNDLIKASSPCPVIGELLIYDRGGGLIFHTKDLQKGWNGIYKGIQQSTGVFIYQIKYQYQLKPGSFYKKGSFVLIR